LTNALRSSCVEDISISCITVSDKERYEEQILLANTLRAPHLPRINKYHVTLTDPFEKSDFRLTLALMSTMKDVTFETAMCLADISDGALREAASSLSLSSLTFIYPIKSALEKSSCPHELQIKGTQLSEYVALRRANQGMLPHLLGTHFLQGAQLPKLGEAFEEAWAGPETAAALASVNRRFHNIAKSNREKVFREPTWERVEQCLRETKSELDLHKRYQLVKASIGEYGFLYKADWIQIWQTLKNDFNQLVDSLIEVDTQGGLGPPSGSKRSASPDLADDHDAKHPRT